MSHVVNFLKKYKTELSVVLVLLLIPIIEPIFEVVVKTLFTYGTVVGTWVRTISSGGICF